MNEPTEPASKEITLQESVAATLPRDRYGEPLFIPPKSGIKTTEFWVTVVANILAIIIYLYDTGNAPWAAAIAAPANGVYVTLRGTLKHGYTQKAGQLQRIGTKAAAVMIGLFLVCGGGLVSCGGILTAAPTGTINFQRDELEITISREHTAEGERVVYYYRHTETDREFRLTIFNGLRLLEVKDPDLGWIKFDGGAKSGLPSLPYPDLVIPPGAPQIIPEGK